MKSIIVAYDRNRGIGADNDLLWQRDLPADLQHFKDLTTGNTIIMGRKTYESIGRPLPNRQNIVVSRDFYAEGVETASSLEEAYQLATHDIFVIGGGQIYTEALNDMDQLYVTEVHADFPNATVFFPEINLSIWQEISRDRHEADEANKYTYDFVTYRKSS